MGSSRAVRAGAAVMPGRMAEKSREIAENREVGAVPLVALARRRCGPGNRAETGGLRSRDPSPASPAASSTNTRERVRPYEPRSFYARGRPGDAESPTKTSSQRAIL